ncbi:hypothetical protein Purlil1_12323 [Purpureocillium lilacinum]|uniref:Reverse transcriptase n=1 Tax=Purpureocillium lilacinum TaxID=33203 RepID=A0ABR0BHD4_PURLI|nr:hypothetical protein Purlil1_12323 [Purpureocillium lilacinum]
MTRIAPTTADRAQRRRAATVSAITGGNDHRCSRRGPAETHGAGLVDEQERRLSSSCLRSRYFHLSIMTSLDCANFPTLGVQLRALNGPGDLKKSCEIPLASATSNGLSLLNSVDVPTIPRSNTIDLAFSNIALADAVVEDHLATSSDHFTLSISLPQLTAAPPPTGKIRLTSEEEAKRLLEMMGTGAAATQPSTDYPQGLDTLASAVTDLPQSAAKAAGRPVRKGARSAAWRAGKCTLAAVEYRVVRRIHHLGNNREVQLAKRAFQRAVRRVKRGYWRDLIDGFKDSASVFEAVRRLRTSGPFQPPPLQVGDPAYETQLEKANALRRATLERRTSQDDISSAWAPMDPVRSILFVQHISPEEVRDAILRTGNTSLGSDNITVQMLRTVWLATGSLVHKLYQGCLDIGHHPKSFREADVFMIPKPGRRIARRLTWASVHYVVLHSQQAGTLPKRSAVNLVAALVHNIEESFSRVSGSDDTIVAPAVRTATGVSASPILFLLYTKPIYRLSSPKELFGDAGDIAFLCVGNSLD